MDKREIPGILAGDLSFHTMGGVAYTGLKELIFQYLKTGGKTMPENVMPGPVSDLENIRESVCIHTRKIFDSCRE